MTEGMPGTAVGGAGGAGTAHAAAPQPSAASGWWGHFKAAVKRLKREVLALHYAMQVLKRRCPASCSRRESPLPCLLPAAMSTAHQLAAAAHPTRAHAHLQDPRVGLLPRLLGLLAVAYALSPLDVVPDFIPVLGLVDDLLILPGAPLFFFLSASSGLVLGA